MSLYIYEKLKIMTKSKKSLQIVFLGAGYDTLELFGISI